MAGAPWLVPELAETGITCSDIHIPAAVHYVEAPPPLPSELRILTYLPDKRAAFYGAEQIHAAAVSFPNVSFDVVGGKGCWATGRLQAPENLHFHGWESDMDADILPLFRWSYAWCSTTAVGATVIEGLLFGRHVVYSYTYPHCQTVSFQDQPGFIATLRSLEERNKSGALALNTSGAAYARQRFEPSTVVREFLSHLELSLRK